MGTCTVCRRITIDQIHDVVNEAYDEVKSMKGGKNADYIPFLANVDPELFGVCLCLVDGTMISVGDVDHVFGIESVSKVPTAILAMSEIGPQEMLERIGADATGLPFNSIMAMLLEQERPSTPLVNAGAISACSIVQPTGNAEGKWKAITDNMAALAGSELVLIDELYRSESATDFNNRSIAWLLKDFGRIYDDPDMSLDLYTRQCSMGITAKQMAIMAATIAADGTNPVTGKSVFESQIAPKITSLITTVGFYEHTGDWLYRAGIPAKSGVGGGVLGVLPGLFGIAAFSPPLDDAGNSVKGQAVVQRIMEKLQLNIFSSLHICQIGD